MRALVEKKDRMPSTLGTCKLCRQDKILLQSHIIPKFIVSWLKETGSGFFRMATSPNIKYQDFPKRRLLCSDCEQRFSSKEEYFSRKVFYPYIETKPAHIYYSQSLHYFLVSVLWRILAADPGKYKKQCRKFSKELEETEEDWRLYLIAKKTSIKSDVHLFISDILETATIPVRHFNVYMARGIDATIATSSSDCLVYCKLARFCIFSPLMSYDLSKWVNTKISNGKGKLIIPQKLLDGRIGDFFLDRIRSAYAEYNRNISERQRQKIHEYQEKNIRKIINSDLGEALLRDSYSAIDKGFFPKRKLLRNEPCPCGSGLKYKKCCGK